MTCMGNLHWLTFAAIWCAPHRPMLFAAYGVATVPELWGDSGIGAVAKHLA